MAHSRIRLPDAFLLLIITQAAHSLEEFFGALWEVLTPARLVSGFFSQDLQLGFAIVNSLIVMLGVLCYLGPIRLGWKSSTAVAWSWVALELGNGIGHTIFAIEASGYFPGIYTAPFLIVFAVTVAFKLLHSGNEKLAT